MRAWTGACTKPEWIRQWRHEGDVSDRCSIPLQLADAPGGGVGAEQLSKKPSLGGVRKNSICHSVAAFVELVRAAHLGAVGEEPFGTPCPCGKWADPAWISACQPAWAHLLGLQAREAVQEATSTFILAPFSYPFLDKLSQTWCQNCEVLVSFCKAAWMTHVISQITDKTGGGLKK